MTLAPTPVTLALFDPSVRMLGAGLYFNVGAAYLAAALTSPQRVQARQLREACFYSGLDDTPPQPHRPVLIAHHGPVPVVIGNNSLVQGAADGEMLEVLSLPAEALELVTISAQEVEAQNDLTRLKARFVTLLQVTHPDGEGDLFWLRALADEQAATTYLEQVFYGLLDLRGMSAADLGEHVRRQAAHHMLRFPLEERPYGVTLILMPRGGLLPRTSN